MFYGDRQMIYAKRINGKQRYWLKLYEDATGFEPLYQEDIDSGEKTFVEAALANCRWYEDHASEVHLRITQDIPGC